MACGSCRGGGLPKFGTINMGGLKGRTLPNPMAMKTVMNAPPQQNQNQQAQQNQQLSPFNSHMSIQRRVIEQQRRMAALRALGK